jgi:hypothetical protein
LGLPFADWNFKNKAAEIIRNGKTYVADQTAAHPLAKGDGIPVGITFDIEGEQLTAQIQGIWWGLLNIKINAPPQGCFGRTCRSEQKRTPARRPHTE